MSKLFDTDNNGDVMQVALAQVKWVAIPAAINLPIALGDTFANHHPNPLTRQEKVQ